MAYKINGFEIHVELNLYSEDVPYYSVYIDKNNNRYFVAYVEDSIYLITRTTPEELLPLLEDKITIANFIRSHTNFYVLNSSTKEITPCQLIDLKDDWFPYEDEFLEQSQVPKIIAYIDKLNHDVLMRKLAKRLTAEVQVAPALPVERTHKTSSLSFISAVGELLKEHVAQYAQLYLTRRL